MSESTSLITAEPGWRLVAVHREPTPARLWYVARVVAWQEGGRELDAYVVGADDRLPRRVLGDYAVACLAPGADVPDDDALDVEAGVAAVGALEARAARLDDPARPSFDYSRAAEARRARSQAADLREWLAATYDYAVEAVEAGDAR